MWLDLLVCATLFSLARLSSAQLLSNLPSCLQHCVDKYVTTCDKSDINCLCRLAAGSFLTNTAQCFETSCNDTTDLDVLLTAFDSECQLSGNSVPAAVISSAEAVAAGSSPSAEATDTSLVTETNNGLGGSLPTAMASMTTQTVQMKETNSAGQVTIVEVPEIFDGTTTIVGGLPTVNPVIVSTSGSLTLASLASSTSFALSATFADTTLEPSNLASLSLGASSTASTSTSSAAAAAPSEGNGSLFTSQNVARKESISGLLGLTIGLVAGIAWA
ncbi:hypothetical protein MMC17_009409 [Xylographa soralifera]|nr:hypothetical protein [Xylographa soralifera]